MCKVYGCKTSGCMIHCCGFCGARDSHRTSFCPIRYPRRQCCANGCNACGPYNGFIHKCKHCGKSDSQHKSSDCPFNPQKAFGKPFFVTPPGLPNPAKAPKPCQGWQQVLVPVQQVPRVAPLPMLPFMASQQVVIFPGGQQAVQLPNRQFMLL